MYPLRRNVQVKTPTIIGSFAYRYLFLVREAVKSPSKIKTNAHSKMNPIYWVVFALLALDAIREMVGASSILGMW
ncbi:hypothetical protein CJP72_15405 [Citrobacter sp. NCU1]|uniref:KPN_01571 family protein n=1 Tax=Citrobacter sp. NCU1 TaxID=2026683 RepID=UPI002170A6B1|nr:hypothetical protein [Citrobacter sp. NCU1]